MPPLFADIAICFLLLTNKCRGDKIRTYDLRVMLRQNFSYFHDYIIVYWRWTVPSPSGLCHLGAYLPVSTQALFRLARDYHVTGFPEPIGKHIPVSRYAAQSSYTATRISQTYH